MAQAGYTPIQLYYSTTAAAVPLAANLAQGELAINIADGKLYYENSSGVVTLLAGAGGAGIVAGSNTQVQYNNSGVFGASANLTFNGTTLTAGGLTTTGTTSTGVLSVTGNTTLGDAAADTVTVNGTITSNMIFTDNTYDIGASGATRPRTLYLGTSLISPSITITGLTTGRVVYTATNGILSSSANLTYAGTDLANSNGDIIIGNNPSVTTRMFRAIEVGSTGNNAGIAFGTAGAKGAIYGQSGVGGLSIVSGTSGAIAFGYSTGNADASANFLSLGAWTTTGLGVGTSSPAGNLQISGSGDRSLLVTGGTAGTVSVQLGDSSAAGQGGMSYDNSVDALFFKSNGGERMRIDSAGDVTIGTTTNVNAYELVVLNDIAIRTNTDASGSTNLRLGVSGSMPQGIATLNGTKTAVGGGDMIFNTATGGVLAEKMRLIGDGNLAIGATSANGMRFYAIGYSPEIYDPTTYSAKFAYYPKGSQEAYEISTGSTLKAGYGTLINISVNDNNGSDQVYYGAVAQSAGNSGANFVFGRRTGTQTWAESARIDSSGNLGLGATPNAWISNYKVLQSGNGSSFVGFSGNNQTFVVSNAYNDGAWKYIQTSGAGYYNIGGVSNGQHSWFIAPSGTAGNAITFTQAMTLDSSGNLLVGTTTAAGKLTVVNTYTNTSDATIVASSSIPGINLRTTTNTGRFSIFTNYSTTNSTSFLTATGASNPSTETIFLDHNTGNVRFAGVISVGGATPASSGVGITFPASQSASTNANTLDDYEEGTFTPVLTDGTNNVASYYYQYGSYIKVGRLVTINCTISVNNKGSLGSGDVYISGLPFTSGYLNASPEQQILAAKVFPLGSDKYAVGTIDNNTTLIRPLTLVTGGQNAVQGGNVTGGSQLFFTGTYWSAS